MIGNSAEELVRAPAGLTLPGPPPARLNLYTPKQPLRAKVVDKRRLTDPTSPNRTWHIVLSLRGSRMAGQYRAGQSIGIVPEGRFTNPEFNFAHTSMRLGIRLYSICSPCWGDDWHGQTVSICVKRDILEDRRSGALVFGSASNYVCDARPGSYVQITGPCGKAILLPDDPLDYSYVFVATGTGIAPFRAMLIELFAQGFRRPVWLIFGTSLSTNLLYHDLFCYLADRYHNFHYVTAISREQKTADGQRLYVQHRLRQYERSLAPLLARPSTKMYLCGLKRMEIGVYRWLLSVGSDLVRLPSGLTAKAAGELPAEAPEWKQIERSRDKTRLLVETY